MSDVQELMAELQQVPSFLEVYLECCCGMCGSAGDVVATEGFVLITRED